MMKEIDLPTTSSLVAFEATVRLGSMTAAAQELNITQPLVSQRIRSLEDVLGGVLINRSKKPLKATRAGQHFYNNIQGSMQNLLHAFASAKHDLNDNKKKISICAYFGFAFHWIMPRLQRLQEAFPDYLFEIQPTNSLDDMTQSNADIVFHFSSKVGKHRFEKSFIKEQVFPVCSPEFAARYKLTDHDEITNLRNLPLLHKDQDDPRWFNWHNWAELLGIQYSDLPVMFCYNNYPLVVESAVNGHGICLGWQGIIDNFIADGKLIKLGPVLTSTTRGYLICSDYQDTLSVGKVIEWFLKEVE
ncbi:LysR family transcriptional regulator [Marinomonas pollencensis]|uniref:LysR family transcriptional regulator n=1 Tax=Marinomonas pollencensis TaxID=491954 RepID=A0A3E0D7Y0_9GAMM|nr:LysR family transcriptional regulator [Marinomonas pollencensis]REG78205.1 LysR family transcriptional regulator [Marinomonas pollencensis]